MKDKNFLGFFPNVLYDGGGQKVLFNDPVRILQREEKFKKKKS
jgi:hypothetical protein